MLRTVRHVVLRVCCRTVCLRIGIDTEDRVVAGLARPHPVVGLATKLTHRLRHGEDEAQVGEIAVCSGVELVAFEIWLDFKTECRVCCLHLLRHHILDGIEEF